MSYYRFLRSSFFRAVASRPLRAMCFASALLFCVGSVGAQDFDVEAAASLEGNARCLKCHGDPQISTMSGEALAGMVRVAFGATTELREGDAITRIYIPTEVFGASAHKEMDCTECHKDVGLLPHDQSMPAVGCKDCHEEAVAEYETGSHRPGVDDGKERPDCVKCHGSAHVMGSFKQPRTYDTALGIVAVCVECHGDVGAQEFDPVQDYRDSTHGKGLFQKGLATVPTCGDCHSSHAALPSDVIESPVHPHNASETCGKCHKGVERQYMESVHGKELAKTIAGEDAGEAPVVADAPDAEDEAHGEEGEASGEKQEAASCTSCHSSHGVEEISDKFLLNVLEECSDCHLDLSKSYLVSYHGKAAHLGMASAAVCSSCHGSHDIRRVDDADSRVASANRLATCRECHENASDNFAGYVTHLGEEDLKDYPILHLIWFFMEVLIIGTMAFFLPHAALWAFRSVAGRVMNPRGFHAAPHHERRIQRFSLFHRFTHILIITSFMGLVATGFPLKYSHMEWAAGISEFLGGVRVMGAIHRFFAVVTFVYAAMHISFLINLVFTNWPPRISALWGPNSLIPNFRDLKDIFAMLRWFCWLGPRPRFDKWTYFEKFDYFGAAWGITIIGFSGLVLWMPTFFTHWLPGWVLNAATIVHSAEALLAASFIFTIHFFNTHLRPEKFPIDMVIFTGQMTESEMEEERPEEYARLVEAGTLDEHVVEPLPFRFRFLAGMGGVFAFLFGIALIVGAVVAEAERLEHVSVEGVIQTVGHVVEQIKDILMGIKDFIL